MSAKKDRMTIHNWNGVSVLDLGEMDIWDGADLALLRETLTNLIVGEGRRLIGVNMTHVKYVPSGFFGMLFDWHERGTEIRLYTPQPNVAAMLWFRQFFRHEENGSYLLTQEPQMEMIPNIANEWEDYAGWTEEELTEHFRQINIPRTGWSHLAARR